VVESPAMGKRYWLIRGYGCEPPFEMRVHEGQLTRRQIKELLRALAAKAGLSFAEIVGAYATRGTKIANDLLAVQGGLNEPCFMCGCSPHFTACIVDESGEIIPYLQPK
jgi:hypothetical protein